MDHIWTNLNGLTQSAIVFITVIAILFHARWTRRNTALGPTFLTTLGIFFCFETPIPLSLDFSFQIFYLSIFACNRIEVHVVRLF